jgi:hypothetical protein
MLHVTASCYCLSAWLLALLGWSEEVGTGGAAEYGICPAPHVCGMLAFLGVACLALLLVVLFLALALARLLGCPLLSCCYRMPMGSSSVRPLSI